MYPVKLLSDKLAQASIPIEGVSDLGGGQFRVDFSSEATQEERDAAAAITAAFDPVAEIAQQEAIEEAERQDFAGLEADITNQVDWINGTIPEIDNGLAAVGAFTNATQRAIVTGLLQNQRRILLILRGVLRAFRFVVRRLR